MARHLLIAACTSKYQHLDDKDQRPELTVVADSVVRLFTQTLKGYTRELPEIGENPPTQRLKMSLDSWFAAPERDAADWIVFYYTGHGEVVESDALYLLTSDYTPYQYVGTAFALSELATLVLAKRSHTQARQIRNLLVIIDACFAGAGAISLARQLADIFRRSAEGMFYVLGAALPRQEATAGALASALIESVEDLSSRNVTQEVIFFEQLMPEINRRLRVHEAILASVSSAKEIPRFFPNPNFVDTKGQAILVTDGRRAIADTEFRSRLLSRSDLVAFDTRPEPLFIGRNAILEKLSRFLSDPNDNATRVVTGGPGAGKSAILRRLVSLSETGDQAGRTPQIPAFGARLHLKGKTLFDATSQLAEAVGAKPDPDSVLERLTGVEQPVRIVVDALDESAQPSLIVETLLRPMNALNAVKLLVGTRNTFAGGLDAAEVLDIDTPDYASVRDIAAIVEAVLLSADRPDLPTPYAGRPQNARRIAEIVAAKAYPNFLMARLFAEDLRARPEPLDPETVASLPFPPTVTAAFDEFLANFGENETRVRDLLRPLAYAEGQGLPWDNIWPPLASALAFSDRVYNNDDVVWVLEHAGFFILEIRDGGRSVYRLFHQALAETAARRTRYPMRVQSTFASVLIDCVPHLPGSSSPNWSFANRYIRTHLGTHAALAGQLDSLVANPAFLAVADPDRLLTQLHRVRTESARAAAKAYRRAAHLLRDAEEPERLAYLDLAARQNGIVNFITSDAGREPLPWRASWAHWSAIEPSQIVAEHNDWVEAVLVAELNDRSVVISASRGGVKVIPVTGGEVVWAQHEHRVTSLALAAIERELVVVTGCHDGNVRLWRLTDGSLICPPFGGHGGDDPAVRAVQVTTIAGRTVVISAGNDGMIKFWDTQRRQPAFEPIAAFIAYIQDLVLGEISGDSVMVGAGSGGPTGYCIRVWNLGDRTLMSEFPLAKGQMPRGLALARGGQGTVIAIATGAIATGDPGGVSLLDPISGTFAVLPSSSVEAVDAVTAAGLNGRQLIIADGMRYIGVWDLEEQRLLGRLLGHQDIITALVVASVNDRATLVSGSCDKTVRVWDLADALASSAQPQLENHYIRKVQIGQHNGRPVVVSLRAGPVLNVWDLVTGALLDYVPVRNWEDMDRDEFIEAELPIATGGGEGHLYVALGGRAKTLILECVEFGAWRQMSQRHDGEPVTALAFGQLNGREVLAIAYGGHRRFVRLWDLTTRQALATQTGLHRGIYRLDFLSYRNASLLVAQLHGESAVWQINAASGQYYYLETGFDRDYGGGAADIGGEPVVITGHRSGEIRAWLPLTGKTTSFRPHQQAVRAVAATTIDNRPVVLSGGDDRTLCISSIGGLPLLRVQLDADILDIAACPQQVVVGTRNGLLALQCRLRPEPPLV